MPEKNRLQISNRRLDEELNNTPMIVKTIRQTTSFFENTVKRHDFARNIEAINKRNATFRTMSKLINDI